LFHSFSSLKATNAGKLKHRSNKDPPAFKNLEGLGKNLKTDFIIHFSKLTFSSYALA